jgi:hypothetical protein
MGFVFAAGTIEFVNASAPGISGDILNEPFWVKAATCDASNLTLTVGLGSADFGGGTRVVKLVDSTVLQASPSINTDYYLYMDSAGTFTVTTSATPVAGTVRLAKITTGNPITTAPVRADLRGQLPIPAVLATTAAEIAFETATRAVGNAAKAAPANHDHGVLGQANAFTVEQTVLDLKVSGIGGATSASRYVGATSGAAPASGAFLLGDYAIDQTGVIWICTTAGTPGTWTKVGTLSNNTPLLLASAGVAGTGAAGSRDDHKHPWTGLGVLANAQTWAGDPQTFSGAIIVTGATKARGGVTNDSGGSDLQLSGASGQNVRVISGQSMTGYTGPSRDQGPMQHVIGWKDGTNGQQARTIFTAQTRNDAYAQEGDILFNG